MLIACLCKQISLSNFVNSFCPYQFFLNNTGYKSWQSLFRYAFFDENKVSAMCTILCEESCTYDLFCAEERNAEKGKSARKNSASENSSSEQGAKNGVLVVIRA